MRTLAIRLRTICTGRTCLSLLGSGLIFTMSVATSYADRPPSPSPLRIGGSTDEGDDPYRYRPNDRYNPPRGNEIDKLERDLNEICPCLFIRLIDPHTGADTREQREWRDSDDGEFYDVILRHPGDVGDLSDNLRENRNLDLPRRRRRRSQEELDAMTEDFCDCYERHRAGCNLLWLLANGDTPTTIWRSDLGEGNAHRHGHVAYRPGHREMDRTTHPDEDDRGPSEFERPSSIGLAHELAHAYFALTDVPREDDWRSEDHHEFMASQAENQIRREMQNELRRQAATRDEFLWPWLRPRDIDDFIDGTYERAFYSSGRRSRPIPNRSRERIPMDDLFDCDEEENALLPPRGGTGERDKQVRKDESSYKIAVQIPEICVGTTYEVTEGRVVEEGLPAVTEDGEDPDDMPPVELPVAAVPEKPPGKPGGPRDGTDVPVATTPKATPPEQPREDTPDADPPNTEVTDIPTPPVEDEPRDMPQEDVPDLGLVKAGADIVALVVTSTATGEPVTDVGIKLLPAESPLPGSELTEASPDAAADDGEAFDAASFFEDEAAGGFTDAAGEIELASPRPPDGTTEPERTTNTAAAAPETAIPASQPDGAADTPKAPRISIAVETEPTDGVVVALTGEDVLEAAQKDSIVASFVTGFFALGQQPLIRLEVPRDEANAVKTRLETMDWVSWFEPDPCWSKQTSEF